METYRKPKLTEAEKNALDGLVGKTKKGVLVAADVVKAARHKNHPLHGRFLWDVEKAACQYWLEQARDIIQIYVTIIGTNKTPVRALVSMSMGARGPDGYMPIAKALGSGDTLKTLKESFSRDLLQVLSRHEYLRETMRGIFSGIELLAKKALD